MQFDYLLSMGLLNVSQAFMHVFSCTTFNSEREHYWYIFRYVKQWELLLNVQRFLWPWGILPKHHSSPIVVIYTAYLGSVFPERLMQSQSQFVKRIDNIQFLKGIFKNPFNYFVVGMSILLGWLSRLIGKKKLWINLLTN